MAALAAVGVIVAIYSRLVDRWSRLQVARGASILFCLVLAAFWAALRVGGPELGAQRPFVWAVYSLVDVYSVVMVGIFWTYTNDVVSTAEANRLYGPIGLGGILGGVAGGLLVDALATLIGPIDLLLLCAVTAGSGAIAVHVVEHRIKPPPRKIEKTEHGGLAMALGGAREVLKSRYLLLLVGIVIAYEFAATVTDFAINVIFEESFHDEAIIAKMYGRLGWIASGTAVLVQLILVPLLLPKKRIALLVAPIVMTLAAIGTFVAPIVAFAIVLASADRGLNYSLQQVTKESLYVPLTDAQKYKAKAFIDMFVDRAAKAFAALVLLAEIARAGVSARGSIVVATLAFVVWLVLAWALGRRYQRHVEGKVEATEPIVTASKPVAAT